MHIKIKRSPKAPSGGSGQARSFDQYRCKGTHFFPISKQILKKMKQIDKNALLDWEKYKEDIYRATQVDQNMSQADIEKHRLYLF